MRQQWSLESGRKLQMQLESLLLFLDVAEHSSRRRSPVSSHQYQPRDVAAAQRLARRRPLGKRTSTMLKVRLTHEDGAYKSSFSFSKCQTGGHRASSFFRGANLCVRAT